MNSLSNTHSRFNKQMCIFFKSTKEFTLAVKSGKAQNSGYPKLQHFTKVEIRELSALPFSLHLMFDETLRNLIVCRMISQKLHTKVVQTSLHVAVDTR